MKKVIKKVTFYYESIYNAEKIINEFFSAFEKDFINIDNFFNTNYPQIPIYLVNKPQLDALVKKTSEQYTNCDIPKWLDGFSTSENIHILNPNSSNVIEMVKVALHETVHFIIYQMGLKQPPLKVLDEGLAVYLSQQNSKSAFNLIVNEYLTNNLKKLSDFCIRDSIKFAELKGYQYSYYIAEFLISTYTKNDYINWLKNPELFLKEIPNLDIKFKKYIVEKINIVIQNKNK